MKNIQLKQLGLVEISTNDMRKQHGGYSNSEIIIFGHLSRLTNTIVNQQLEINELRKMIFELQKNN